MGLLELIVIRGVSDGSKMKNCVELFVAELFPPIQRFSLFDPASRNAAGKKFLSARRHEQRKGSSQGSSPAPAERTRWVESDRGKRVLIARVVWKEAAAPLCLLVQNRAQQEELLLAVDPTSGATRELLREKDAAWLNLDHKPMPTWLKDGREFLWSNPGGGTWQVELHSADGALVRAITPADFNLDEFIDLNETDRSIVVAGGPDPRERHLFRFALETKAEPQALTRERTP